MSIDVPEKIANETEFHERVSAWSDVAAHPSNESNDHALLRFRDWLELNFGDDAAPTFVHEATHVAYHRAVGDDPKVYGPHPFEFRGKTRWANGAVSGLPGHIAMSGPRIGVAKCYLGPAYIYEQIWPEEEDVWKRAKVDVEIFDSWFRDRYHESDFVKQKFMAEVRSSIQKDLNQPFFREQLFWTAVEYQARISVQSPVLEEQTE